MVFSLRETRTSTISGERMISGPEYSEVAEKRSEPLILSHTKVPLLLQLVIVAYIQEMPGPVGWRCANITIDLSYSLISSGGGGGGGGHALCPGGGGGGGHALCPGGGGGGGNDDRCTLCGTIGGAGAGPRVFATVLLLPLLDTIEAQIGGGGGLPSVGGGGAGALALVLYVPLVLLLER